MSDQVKRTENEDGTIDANYLVPAHAGPMTSEALRDIAEIPDTWIERSFTCNKWDSPRAQDRGIQVLWQAKGTYAPPADHVRGLESLIERLEQARPAPQAIKYTQPTKRSDRHLFELSPVDLHLGMYAWAQHTGADYDIDIASSLFLGASNTLIERAAPFNPQRILLILGNDFLHVDNFAGTTTKGTFQPSTSGTFPEIVERGIESLISLVELCRKVAPVDILIVPGNHDFLMAYMIGQVLEAWYRDIKSVTVDAGANATKYYHWGVNLLGFVHGKLSASQLKELPLMMAADEKELWAATKFREWHLGHVHRSTNAETKGVRIRHLPSLAPNNIWHDNMMYRRQQRACEAYLWGEQRGYSGHLSVNVDPDTGELL